MDAQRNAAGPDEHCVGLFRSEQAARTLAQKLRTIGLSPWSDRLPGGSGDPRFRVFVTGLELDRARALVGEVPTNEDVDHAAIAKRNVSRHMNTRLTGAGIFVLLVPILIVAGMFTWLQVDADATTKATWGPRIFVLYFVAAFVLQVGARALGLRLSEAAKDEPEGT